MNTLNKKRRTQMSLYDQDAVNGGIDPYKIKNPNDTDDKKPLYESLIFWICIVVGCIILALTIFKASGGELLNLIGVMLSFIGGIFADGD
jgi:hypothetical protein